MNTSKRQAAVIEKNGKYITAVLQDHVLDDVIVEEIKEDALRTGDIYVGKVKNVIPNINAAFIEVQKSVMCYLPFPESERKKIVQGQEFPVQVKKAAVKTKQAVVSRKLEFAGKYVVVTTENHSKSISSRIMEKNVREHLQTLLEQFKDYRLGMIFRTSCEAAPDKEILAESRQMVKQASELLEKAEHRTCFSRLYRSPDEFIKFLQNTEVGEFDRIITDQKEVYDTLKAAAGLEGENIVLYEDTSYPLDKLLGIGSKLEKALAKHVWLKSGGSLVIEPTEALTVIDVNTEKAITGKRNSETTFFKLNMEAAREAARQIRVRNLSGIILIDFIDMKKKEHEKQLLLELEKEFRKDKVRTSVIDITRLGLVEITRMKVRKPLRECL